MKTIAAAKFKEQCVHLLDSVDEEGIVITKRGMPVAKLLPFEPKRRDDSHLIGALRGKVIVNPDDDLFLTGA